jgi:hypothetical protein
MRNSPRRPRLETNTPLWYYVLKEAELRATGTRLGPLVEELWGEVIIALLQTDPGSYLVAEPTWKPTLSPKSRSSPKLIGSERSFSHF